MNGMGLNVLLNNQWMLLQLPEQEALALLKAFEKGTDLPRVVGGRCNDGVEFAFRWADVQAMHTVDLAKLQQQMGMAPGFRRPPGPGGSGLFGR